jgi:hypothetical protein
MSSANASVSIHQSEAPERDVSHFFKLASAFGAFVHLGRCTFASNLHFPRCKFMKLSQDCTVYLRCDNLHSENIFSEFT